MSSILFEKIDAVAKITLNRPDSFNSFTREMALRMQDLLDQCKNDTEVRAVYITGNGKAFCAGQDIKELLDPENEVGMDRIVPEHYNPIIEKILNLPKPVVCAVNGVAAGAGANLALMCDVTLATASASFIQAFTKIGLIPDSGGTYSLPRLIGFQKAIALAMLGDKVMADEAERMGMIYKYYPDDTFADDTFAIAVKLSKMPTKALAYTKELFNRSLTNSFEEQLQLEAVYQAMAGNTADYKEGISAFVEKRKPVFKGE